MSDESRIQPRNKSQIRLTRQEPPVDEQHPWNDDRLWLSTSRSPLLIDLERVVERVTGKSALALGGRSLTISLDGKWGTGKTFFLKRWTKELGERAIYYNAWSEDFFGDPLIPLLRHISKRVSDKNPSLKEEITKFSKLKLTSATISKLELTSVMIGSRPLALTFTLPGIDDIDKADETRKKIKDLLEKQARKEPMIIVIDELDRCRPDYAVKMLERTKHLCYGQGMLFVYGINRDELIKSIQSLYGNIDAKKYIRRFFDMNFTLPLADPNIIENYIEWLISKYLVSVSDRIDLDMFKDSARHVIGSSKDLTLRDVEQCVRAAALVVDKWELDSDKVSAKEAYDAVMADVVVRLQEGR